MNTMLVHGNPGWGRQAQAGSSFAAWDVGAPKSSRWEKAAVRKQKLHSFDAHRHFVADWASHLAQHTFSPRTNQQKKTEQECAQKVTEVKGEGQGLWGKS